MILIEDVAQKVEQHELKHAYFKQNGITIERYPLPVADYIIANEKVLDVIARKKKRGVDIKKMDFLGTYDVCVDTKKDMQEIVGNVCGKQHARFRDECILAENNGIKLYILVEEPGITSVQDVFRWQNPRMHRYNKIAYMHKLGKWQNVPLPKAPPTKGATLAKAMITFEKKYGVEFIFVPPEKSAEKVVELLTGGKDEVQKETRCD